jgi:hypothetical protein
MGAYDGRRALITGGLGFIGSSLARRLVDERAEVTVVDSLIPEYGGNLFNVAGIRDRVKVNISDVRDPYSMVYLVRGPGRRLQPRGTDEPPGLDDRSRALTSRSTPRRNCRSWRRAVNPTPP